ncbi:MAG TPA: T9SS type A sorting domain-containing protein [Rubricoccaceae bacterium]
MASEAGPAASALSVRVGPNPARGTATVHVGGVSGETTLRLVDVRGRVVREMGVAAGASATVLDLAGLAPGVYGVRVEGGGGVATVRLVVVR